MFNFRFTWPSFPFTYNLLSTIWTNQVHPELIWTVYTWTWSFPSLKKFSTWIWPLQCVAPYKGIQDSLGFWIPRRVFRILGTGFQYLSVKLGFWILIIRAIPDSLSGIPDSQPRIPDSTFKFFPDSGFHKRKNEGKFSVNIAPNLSTELISLKDPACKARLGYNNVTRGMGRKNLRKRFNFCLRRIS